MLLKIVLK